MQACRHAGTDQHKNRHVRAYKRLIERVGTVYYTTQEEGRAFAGAPQAEARRARGGDRGKTKSKIKDETWAKINGEGTER